MTGSIDVGAQIQKVTKALAEVDADLAWEMAGTAADVAGMVDPTPASDLVGAGISLRNGDFLGAGLSVVGIVPYVGDALGKPAKAARAYKRIDALREKAAALSKELNDLRALQKEHSLDSSLPNANRAKTRRDAEKTVDTEEKVDTQKAKNKDCEDCSAQSPPLRAMKKVKVTPCFSPAKLDPSKAKEFAAQLKRQEDAINRLSVKEFNEARAYFNKNKRSGTGAEQRRARGDYERELTAQLYEEFMQKGVPGPKGEATKKAKSIMESLAALHEPDMIAGGKDLVVSMGDKSVNSSIGSQWRNRIASIDTEAKAIPDNLQGATKMNVELPIC